MQKIIALIILVIPGLGAAYGIKLMRDSVFSIVNPPFEIVALQFIVGLILTILGIWFIAGYVLYREKKNKRAQARFMEKKDSSK